MRIKVLGGSGSELPGSNLTGFLINGSVVLDAGTISSSLKPAQLTRITHVVLSHAHLDHTKGIPFMLDNVMGRAGRPVVVAAAGEVVDTLKAHLFNDRLWPDFTKIPSISSPVLKFKRLAVGRRTRLAGGLTALPVRVNHTVPTTGFIIEDEKSAVVFSGDTNTTDDIWRAAAGLKGKLGAVLVETSFPNRLRRLADKSGHLTPGMLGRELEKLDGYDGPVYVYHVKRPYLTEIKREIKSLGRKGIAIVKEGMDIRV